ncbi:hypothetical protein Bbelb_061030 [Branchiostoma belcheri]|nr:hypothetical protein Bbelb_061030 [Branchiostoma belcheri]
MALPIAPTVRGTTNNPALRKASSERLICPLGVSHSATHANARGVAFSVRRAHTHTRTVLTAPARLRAGCPALTHRLPRQPRLEPKNRKDRRHPVANLAARPSATSDNVNKHPHKRPRTQRSRGFVQTPGQESQGANQGRRGVCTWLSLAERLSLTRDVDATYDTLYTPKTKRQNHFHTQGVSIRCHNASFSRTKTHILKNQNDVHHLQPNSKTYTKSQTYPSTQTLETAANAIFVFPHKTSALGIYIPTRR